jgi:cell division transport system permease protein
VSRLAYFVRETLISLRRNLLMTFAGIMTVSVSLFLFGGILLMQRLVDHGTSRWKDVKFEIFMHVDVPKTQVDDVRAELTELRASKQITDFSYLSKDDAYREFEKLFDDEPALVENTRPEDLPESFRVVPTDVEDTTLLAQRFKSQPGVESVMTADKVIDAVLGITRWVRWAFIAMAVILLASSLFLIVNTIRLATFARRREIEVMKLVGASNSFVRIPFMAEGLVQGAIGAGFAFGLVYALKAVLSSNIDNPTGLWRSFYLTNGDAMGIGILVLVIGAAIGTVGSAIGLRRFLEA